MLANSVAQSFMSPDNSNSRGQRMFLLRRQNSEKWTTSGPDPPRDVTHHQQQWEDGGAWPQRAPAGRQHYVTGQPPGGYPPHVRPQSAPQHYLPSGPRPARSTSMQEPTLPQRHAQFLPRVAAPAPQQRALLQGQQTPPQYLHGQFPPGPAAQKQGFLRPARPPGPMTGAPMPQMRSRSGSFGSLPAAVRSSPGDWQSPASRHFTGVQHQRGHLPASSQAYMHRAPVPGHYGISDL